MKAPAMNPLVDGGQATHAAGCADRAVQQVRCTWCGYIYDSAVGDPDRGIAPGTLFDRLPESWCCPDCRAPQADFAPLDGDGQGLRAPRNPP